MRKRILPLVLITFLTNLFATPLTAALDFSLVNDQVWQVTDEIIPTRETIEWQETGEYPGPIARIMDAGWIRLSCRFHLVSGYIFALFSEVFDFTTVNAVLTVEGYGPFSSFEDFETAISNDPLWWLEYSWNLPTEWLGISLNRTTTVIECEDETSTVTLGIWCHITNVFGFFVTQTTTYNRLEPMLTGFRLSDIFW